MHSHHQYLVSLVLSVPSHCIGIGIMSDDVEEFYKEVAVVRDINELPSKLLTLISRKIKRG